jgi:PAS domain S-box-containing protein
MPSITKATDIRTEPNSEAEHQHAPDDGRDMPGHDPAWMNSQDLQLVVDGNGIYRDANNAWTGILGWRRDEVIGCKHPHFIHPDDHEASKNAFAGASIKQLPIYVNRVLRKDGAYRWVGWVAARDGNLIYASGRDITVEKEAAEKLAATQEQLRQAQKMELLGQLTGGIAHDFNNLIGIIHLNLELIRERVRDDRETEEMAAMALRAAERGASLTHQLLAYARQQPLEPKIVDVEALLTGMMAILSRTMGENIEISTVIPPGLWPTTIDPHQLENAILNLAVNARDAMPNGGKLIIECANKVFDNDYVEQNLEVLPGQYVTIAVTDTGTGMSKDILERVLEPFFTTKPVGKGSGLGLSMVHGFAKQSGGHLKIYSEPGHGTTINLHLPKASAIASEQRTPSERPDLPASKGGEHVLVVEDDQDLRTLTLRILTGLGYRTIEAPDGPAACLILDQPCHIDLLLTDVVLPNGMQGPALAEQAQLRRPGLKVLFMSGYPRDAVFRDGLLDNRMPLLTKPFPKGELARMVREILDETDGA